jgi:hypothetical protein
MPVSLRRRLSFLLFLALATVNIPAAWSQQMPLPEAPSHRFVDRQNVTAFAALGGLIALDGVHTQLMLDTHRFVEGNPIARPFVTHGWSGQLAGSALAYGTALSISYMLHKTNHHRVERWANWLFVASEAANDTRNLLLQAPAPRQ